MVTHWDSLEPVTDEDNPVLLGLLREWGWVWCARCYMAHSFPDWVREWMSKEVETSIRREHENAMRVHMLMEGL